MEEGYPHEVALPISYIRQDGGTQTRSGLDSDTVYAYAQDMAAGDQFPAIDVYYDGAAYWLADGFHRLEAARENGEKSIIAKVHQGTQRDAILASASANARHGLRRTNQDKRRAVLRLLMDDEWGQWSDREIARRCHVSHPFVAKVREAEAHLLPGYVSERTYTTRHGTVATMRVNGSGVGEAEDTREPVPFPDPIPKAVVVDVDPQTFDMVGASYSGGSIGERAKIRRPFEWNGKLYVCCGGASGPGEKVWDAERVIPVDAWPGRPLTTTEVRERKKYGPCYHFGVKVSYGATDYVIDSRDRVTFRFVAPVTGNVSSEAATSYVQIWELERHVRRNVDLVIMNKAYGGIDAITYLEDVQQKKQPILDQLTHNVSLDVERRPVRKGDLLQAVNNVLDQLRQKEERKETTRVQPAPADETLTVKIVTQSRIDELAKALQLDRMAVIDRAIEQLYEQEIRAKEPAFPTL